MISLLIFNPFNFLAAQDMSSKNFAIVDLQEYDYLNNKTVIDSDTNNYFGAFSVGAGLNHGGIGIKALFGKKEWGGNRGIFGSLGKYNSKMFYSIGLQTLLYKKGYATIAYGNVATETIDYKKETVNGFVVTFGYLWNIGRKRRFFIDTAIGYAIAFKAEKVAFGISGDLSFGIRF